MVAIDGSKVHGTPFKSFSNGFHLIGFMSHMFGWPYVILVLFKDNRFPNLDFYNPLDMKERKFPSSPKKMKKHAPAYKKKNKEFKGLWICLVQWTPPW